MHFGSDGNLPSHAHAQPHKYVDGQTAHARKDDACIVQVLNGDFSVPGGRPEAVTSLLRRLLRVAPKERPDIDAVLLELERLSTEGVPSGLGSSAARPAGADGRLGHRPGNADNGTWPATHGAPQMPGAVPIHRTGHD